MAFLLAEEREVLFTGSGGCGKSIGLLAAALLDVDRPGYRGPAGSADHTARVWRFPSGASLDLGHERYAYVAGQYHMVGVDDLTLFSDAIVLAVVAVAANFARPKTVA